MNMFLFVFFFPIVLNLCFEGLQIEMFFFFCRYWVEEHGEWLEFIIYHAEFSCD